MSEELVSASVTLLSLLILHGLTMVFIVLSFWPYAIVHEAGHWIAAKTCGVKVEQVRFWVDGGLLAGYVKLESPELLSSRQWVCTIAGGLVSGIVFLIVALILNGFFTEYLKFVLILTLYNILPSRERESGFTSDGHKLFSLIFGWMRSPVLFVLVRVGLLIAFTYVGFRLFGLLAGLMFLGIALDEIVKTAKYLIVWAYITWMSKRGKERDWFVELWRPSDQLSDRMPAWYSAVYLAGIGVVVGLSMYLWEGTALLADYYWYVYGLIEGFLS